MLLEGHPGVAAWQLPLHYLLLNNLDPGQQLNLYSVAWTLTLEMLFYLLVPVLAWAARARWGPPSAATLARAIAVSWLASIAFTAFADLQGDGTGGLWAARVAAGDVADVLPGAAAGHRPAPRPRAAALGADRGRRRAPAGLVADASARAWSRRALLAAAAPLGHGIDVYQLLVDASRPLFAVGYGLIVAAAIAAARGVTAGLIALGAASYGIYLLHPVIAAVLSSSGRCRVARDTVLAFIVHARAADRAHRAAGAGQLALAGAPADRLGAWT